MVVADTGIGIRADFRPDVSERLRQADGSATREHGGLGLGLAIVHSLVQLHGGEIEVASEGEGRGATFVVKLPLAPALRRSEPEGDLVGPPPVDCTTLA